jgi:hypothetical protein
MLYVHELATFFRRLVDDQDQTFFPQAEMAQALQLGYQQFRTLVYSHQPDLLQVTYQATVPNSFTLDLNNVLFGTTPTQPRCMRIVRIQVLNGDGSIRHVIKPVGSVEQLRALGWGAIPAWTLQGRVLRFNYQCNDTIQIVYLPQDQVNWVAGVVPASNVYIDDMVEYHDLIPLFAVQMYAVKDFQMNPGIQVQLDRRLKDFLSYLTSTRDGDAARFVQWEAGVMDDFGGGW